MARLTLALAVGAVLAVLWICFSSEDPFFLAPFRESQTAISADYLLREPAGGMLAFQLPVFGEPWRLPFEFPLYQQVTAWVAQTGIPVAQAGRLVSVACFAACLVLVARLMGEWGISGSWGWVGLALVAAAPFHAVYATSHMIESLTLWIGLVYLLGAWRYSQRGGSGAWILALVGGVLVALVKITTWLSVGTILGVICLQEVVSQYRTHGWGGILRGRVLGLVGLGLVPLVAGLVWTKWCAHVRAANPVAEVILAGANVNEWIFGTIGMRLSPKNWILLGGKHLILGFGPLGILVPWLLLRAWQVGKGFAHPLNRLSAVLFAGYAVHAVLLLRLHLRHDYYSFGNEIFLVLSVVLALKVLAEDPTRSWARWMAPLLVFSMAIGGVVYSTARRSYRDLASDEAVRMLRQLPDAGPIITYGLDWSPRVPFAVGRKALMLDVGPEIARAVPGVIQKTRDPGYAALLVLGSGFDEVAAETARLAGLDPSVRVPYWANGYLLLRPGSALARPGQPMPRHPLLDELSRRVPEGAKLPNGIVHKRLPFSSAPGEGFEVVIKRERDAFFYRSHGHSLIRVRGYFAVDPQPAAK